LAGSDRLASPLAFVKAAAWMLPLFLSALTSMPDCRTPAPSRTVTTTVEFAAERTVSVSSCALSGAHAPRLAAAMAPRSQPDDRAIIASPPLPPRRYERR
jgi:hypothetical protein